jgi:hypothetical protein
MATEHDSAIGSNAPDPNNTGPLEVCVEIDGTGSASFEWPPVLDALTHALEQRVCGALGEDVAIIGVRFIDADGRAVIGPVPDGLTLVGFTTAP